MSNMEKDFDDMLAAYCCDESDANLLYGPVPFMQASVTVCIIAEVDYIVICVTAEKGNKKYEVRFTKPSLYMETNGKEIIQLMSIAANINL